MNRLQDLATVVTGAASGLGEATARRFVSEGARVLLCDINQERGQALASELGATFLRVDVSVEKDVAAAVEKAVSEFGRLDCMINNAGVVGVVGAIKDISEADWDRSFAILLKSVFFGMKHAARAMIPQRNGSILSTTSIAGLAALGPHAYTAAKHGVVGLTKSVASELGNYGIRVNAVAPGSVPTNMTGQVFGGIEGARKVAAGKTPLDHVVEPAEIAGGYAYLASPDAIGITGHVLTIDGGITSCPSARKYHDDAPQFIDSTASIR